MSDTDPKETSDPFNGPWLRAQLLENANYVASNDFPELWKWESGSGNLPSKLMVDHSDGASEVVYCRVVGIVSQERAYLEAHGNYNPKFLQPMHKSRLQFTLRNPNDTDFGGDFSLAYKRLEVVQDKVATGRDRSWFLMNGTMRFSYPLWEIKDDGNNGPVETEQTENYQVRHEFMEAKLETQECYQIRVMRVARLGSKHLLEASKFSTALPGSLVEVTFELVHHFIKGKNGDKDVNSYTAFVHEVNILKPPPKSIPSPFQDRRKGGALSVSQSPRKSPSKSAPSRNEQVAAVQAFVPQVSARVLEKRKMPDSEEVSSPSKKMKEASRSG